MPFPWLPDGWPFGRRRSRKRPARRWRRRPYPAHADAAYGRAVVWGDRRSRFHQEPAEVPAYETAARAGERAPTRFRWRGQWCRVTAVVCSWQDSRPPTPDRPERGRTYYTVETEPNGLFLLYYESGRRRGPGKWVVYRSVELLARRR